MLSCLIKHIGRNISINTTTLQHAMRSGTLLNQLAPCEGDPTGTLHSCMYGRVSLKRNLEDESSGL